MYSVYSFSFYRQVKINIGQSVPEQHNQFLTGSMIVCSGQTIYIIWRVIYLTCILIGYLQHKIHSYHLRKV